MRDKKLIDLDHEWSAFAPSGFQKVKLTGHLDSSNPIIRRVPTISAESSFSDNESYNYVSKSVNAFHLSGGCSTIGKRRYQNFCCAASQMQSPEFDHSLTETPQCPSNKNLNNFLVSSTNIYRRDAESQFHKYYLSLTLFAGDDNDLIDNATKTQSRQESSLKITPEKISGLLPYSIEVGIWYPTGGDWLTLEKKRGEQLAWLSSNRYIQQSSRYRSALFEISRLDHRSTPCLPNPSQIHAIAQFAFTKVRRGPWLGYGFEPLKTEKVKIYNPRFAWRESDRFVETRPILPPMHMLNIHVAANANPDDFIGSSETKKENRQLLATLEEKIATEWAISRFVPLDNHKQADLFQSYEFGDAAAGADIAHGLVRRNTPRSSKYRAPPQVNALVDLEFHLRPLPWTLREYRRKRCNEENPPTKYRGELDSDVVETSKWPNYWNVQYGNGCTDESA